MPGVRRSAVNVELQCKTNCKQWIVYIVQHYIIVLLLDGRYLVFGWSASLYMRNACAMNDWAVYCMGPHFSGMNELECMPNRSIAQYYIWRRF